MLWTSTHARLEREIKFCRRNAPRITASSEDCARVETLNWISLHFYALPRPEVARWSGVKGNFIAIFSKHDSLFGCFIPRLDAVHASLALNFTVCAMTFTMIAEACGVRRPRENKNSSHEILRRHRKPQSLMSRTTARPHLASDKLEKLNYALLCFFSPPKKQLFSLKAITFSASPKLCLLFASWLDDT